MDTSENTETKETATLEAMCQQIQKGHIGVIGYGKLKTKITPQDIIRLLGSEVIISSRED